MVKKLASSQLPFCKNKLRSILTQSNETSVIFEYLHAKLHWFQDYKVVLRIAQAIEKIFG